MSRIITSRYATPGAEKPRDNCVSLEQTLSQFYKDIPPSLRYDGVSPEFGQQLWPSMLTMAYKYVSTGKSHVWPTAKVTISATPCSYYAVPVAVLAEKDKSRNGEMNRKLSAQPM